MMRRNFGMQVSPEDIRAEMRGAAARNARVDRVLSNIGSSGDVFYKTN